MKIKKYLNGKIMDYKKKYKEALTWVGSIYPELNHKHQMEAEAFFSELAESEDERIRNFISNELACLRATNEKGSDRYEELTNAIAWLEKQGEHKPVLDIEIPFGAKDSELQEATYLIPEGFHAEIKDDEVLIKKGKQKSAWSKEDENRFNNLIFLVEHSDENKATKEGFIKFINNLKLLRLQNTWKQSEEQMKAPEKIYVHIPDDDIVGTASTQKGFPHQFVTKEYIRTDAFIEKACEGIKHLLSGYIIRNFHFGDSYEMDTLIEDFKNYVKGE